jgi:predicted nucleotidyltransferase
VIQDLVDRKGEVADLCGRFGVRRLEVFGSAATGHFRAAESDIDFLVEFDRSVIEGEYFRAFFGFKESLEELFGRPVDLVADSAIRNPYFRKSVDQTKVLLYAA